MPALAQSRRVQGFTLVELVMVITIAGVLAVAALPRFASRSDDDQSGFAEGVRAVLRSAQKMAIAQHRSVSANLSSSTGVVSACFDSAYPCATPVPDPSGGNALQVSAPSGISLATTAAQVTYDWTGSPNGSGATVTISGGTGGTLITLTIDANTGYVH